jgi:hypothetical protein
MSRGLEVRVLRLNNSLAFEFSREICFDFFVISNAEEHVFWELKPTSMQPIPVIAAAMYAARVPGELQNQVHEAIRSVAADDNATESPLVTRIVYGEVPSGYREVLVATPLNAGERYCAFVFGDGFETAREYFIW